MHACWQPAVPLRHYSGICRDDVLGASQQPQHTAPGLDVNVRMVEVAVAGSAVMCEFGCEGNASYCSGKAAWRCSGWSALSCGFGASADRCRDAGQPWHATVTFHTPRA